MIPAGRNPLAYLDAADLDALVTAMSGIFDAVILDIAGCYRPENLDAIKEAGHIICMESGRRRINFVDIAGQDMRDKVKIIKLDEDNNEELLIDECIDEIYGKRDVNR